MRKSFPVDDLARDGRFERVQMAERFNDPRAGRRAADRCAASSSSRPTVPTRPTPPAA